VKRLSAESRASPCELETLAKVRFFSRFCVINAYNLRDFQTIMQETVSKEELRGMRVRQSRIFTLADKKKIKSVKVQVHDMKLEDMEYEVRTDPSVPAVCITRTM
jgi:hypothetical protein